ncbi:hypothetical protein DFH04_10760 [Clostridium novyi]|uniref:hypothetical protein n=1 Tax=Clostridium novyi TaxID=1542 RepID=UPI000EA169BE|nr:hypothetical protein [Clostridium novyi]AYF55179.1 hypothetical protein DFH04_10760 [Clostridium novyi]
MSILIDTRLNKFQLPVTVKFDKDYYTELNNLLEKYYEHISNISNLPSETIKRTLSNIKYIRESLEHYSKADISAAKECIKNIIRDYINDPYIVSELDKNYAFRGIAPLKMQQKKFGYDVAYSETYEKMNVKELSFFKARVSIDSIKRKDMLHIPFDKRGLISTQRFSMAGIPCMYLSTTTLGCWLEMEMPELELFYVSSYKLPTNLKVLNLCISQHTINGSTGGGYVENYEIEHVCSLIEIFPLVCATSLRVLEKDRSFKSEYIISQILMQAVNELNIDSVAYLSKKMSDYYAYPQTVNIAIPIKSNNIPPFNENSMEVYWDKAKEIKLSDAFNYGEYINKRLYSNYQHIAPFNSYVNEIYHDSKESNKIMFAGSICNYTETSFSKFDEYLTKQIHHKFE